jgi:hypothetical protein
MAFSSELLNKQVLPGGLVLEEYSFNGASVTTGNITADTSNLPKIVDIISAMPSSNGDTAVTVALDAGRTVAKLTFSTSDTGKLTILGRA